MKVLFIQLSDIHFSEGENSLLEKEVQLFEAIRNETLNYDDIFLLITGDSAFSGKKEEYIIATKFLYSLRQKVEEYSKKKVHCIVIPGNHDCNFEKDNQARRNQINIIQKIGDSAIDESVLDQCRIVQEDYIEFRNSLHDEANLTYSDNILSVYQYSFGQKLIVFYCYNTAYMSEIKEQPGKMFLPISLIPESQFTIKADLSVSIFHHPFNWLYPTNKREFSTHISETSDFYLTGHEHEFSKTLIDDLNANTVYHIEGSVLQDSANKFESEFNLIGFDLGEEKFMIESYYWLSEKYHRSSDSLDWIAYKRGRLKLKNKYNITSSFLNTLDDIGGKFTHPNKSDIKLNDLFVYPKLRYFNPNESSEDAISYVLEDSESLIKNLKLNSRLLLFGSENTGKTSLLKTAYKNLYTNGFTPVFIDGHLIRNSKIEDFRKLVNKHFVEQYGEDSLDDFLQENIENIFILIDDVDKNPLKNQKAKGRLIKMLNSYYRNIVLVGNELFAIEEIISDEETEGDLFSDFHQYEILEFNHSLRSKLIYRWYSLGREDFYTDEELWKKCDFATNAISVAMGQKIVPNYPIFILILLQVVETSNPHDLNISSYGNYYQLLILKALTDNIREQSELTLYQNYCSELAHYLFVNKTSVLSETEYVKFHVWVTSYEMFDIPYLTAEKALDVLCKVGIVEKYGDSIEFRYKYTYYFFEAKYLAQNISKHEIKELVAKLCQRLYRTEFANILMFIIHFSNDEFIVGELLKNAKNVFSEFEVCKLEDDIDSIHKLVTEIPKIFLQNKAIEDVRAEESTKIDELEMSESEDDEKSENLWDLSEDVTEIDVISKLNLSFKLIEILGQVLKNNHGAMSGPVKYTMLKETYLIGLRTLNVFFSVLNENTDFLVNQLKEVLTKYKKVEEEKVEKVARQLLFSLCSQMSYIFIKKISDSIGSNKLSEKYVKVHDELSFCSVKLINFLIKLDNVNGFPDRELSLIKEPIERHRLSYFLLKRIVVNHLHRNPVNYKDKQRICTFLGIPIESQLMIEASRKSKNS